MRSNWSRLGELVSLQWANSQRWWGANSKWGETPRQQRLVYCRLHYNDARVPIVSGYLIFVLSRWRCSLCTEIVCNSGFIPSDWIDLVTNHNGRKTEFFLYLMIKLPVSSARSYYWLFGSFGVISAICVTIDDRSGAKSTDLESVHFICSSCCHNCRLLFFI